MTNVFTLEIKYIGCEDKIWRKAQISSNAFLCDLGYMILVTFDTMAYHLFIFPIKVLLMNFQVMRMRFRRTSAYSL